MKKQLDHRILSSFLLYIDHELQSKGEGHKNLTAQFTPAYTDSTNRYVYTTSYRPLVNDTSISGANVLSGVYLNNTLVSIGQSGLTGINHYKGALYFTGQLPANTRVSGAAARKEFTVRLTNKQEWKVLFDTYLDTDNIHPVSATGVPLDTETTPIVFLHARNQDNKPFAFSRLDNQCITVRAIVVADNEFQRIGATSILKNLNYRTVPLVNSTPFDSQGMMTGINYNYTGLSFDNSFTPIILGVKSIDLPQAGDYKFVERTMALVDFEISTIARS
jgi:hypothetical protein